MVWIEYVLITKLKRSVHAHKCVILMNNNMPHFSLGDTKKHDQKHSTHNNLYTFKIVIRINLEDVYHKQDSVMCVTQLHRGVPILA